MVQRVIYLGRVHRSRMTSRRVLCLHAACVHDVLCMTSQSLRSWESGVNGAKVNIVAYERTYCTDVPHVRCGNARQHNLAKLVAHAPYEKWTGQVVLWKLVTISLSTRKSPVQPYSVSWSISVFIRAQNNTYRWIKNRNSTRPACEFAVQSAATKYSLVDRVWKTTTQGVNNLEQTCLIWLFSKQNVEI